MAPGPIISWEIDRETVETVADFIFLGSKITAYGDSIHGISQVRVLEWVAISSSRYLPNPGIEPRFPTLQADALPSEPPSERGE